MAYRWCLQVQKKKIQFACIKITRGGGQNEFFENALLHLFNFTEFLMSTDFVGLLPILIASWNLAVPLGEPIEMQREARSITRVPLPAFTLGEEKKCKV